MLFFTSKDKFIQKGKELGLIWIEDQEESIISCINSKEAGLETPEDCKSFLFVNGASLNNYTFRRFGGVKKLIEVCGLKEEKKYNSIRFLLLEKINASIVFDGDDIYWTSSSIISWLFNLYGISSFERDLFAIPTKNNEIEF